MPRLDIELSPGCEATVDYTITGTRRRGTREDPPEEAEIDVNAVLIPVDLGGEQTEIDIRSLLTPKQRDAIDEEIAERGES